MGLREAPLYLLCKDANVRTDNIERFNNFFCRAGCPRRAGTSLTTRQRRCRLLGGPCSRLKTVGKEQNSTQFLFLNGKNPNKAPCINQSVINFSNFDPLKSVTVTVSVLDSQGVKMTALLKDLVSLTNDDFQRLCVVSSLETRFKLATLHSPYVFQKEYGLQ